jgi:four helix bundle protein
VPKGYLRIDDLTAYRISFGLGDDVWTIVSQWDRFAQDAVRKQLAKATDPIPANLAEGFGRPCKKDTVSFDLSARGSVFEVQDWFKKARNRQLLSEREYQYILTELRKLPREMNRFIHDTTSRLAI